MGIWFLEILKSKKINYLWYLFLALSITPFFLLSFYTMPSIHDDYLGANYIIKYGSINYIINNYMNWTGRYTELLVKSIISPLVYKNYVVIAQIAPMAIISIMGLIIYYACRHFVEKWDSLQLTLILLIIFICGLTDISSFFYWSGGYTAYTIGIIFFMLFIIFLCKMKANGSTTYMTLCSIFSAFAIGCYEVILMNMLWVTLGNVVYSKLNNKGLRHACVLFVVSIISALFSLLAPGNSARASGIGTNVVTFSVFRVVTSACKSIIFSTTSFISWVDNLVIILGAILVCHILIKSINIKFNNFKINPMIMLIWVFLGFSISIFPSVFAYQAVWLHTWQCVCFFFMIGLFFIIFYFILYYDINGKIKNIILNNNFNISIKLLFVFFVIMNSTSNVYEAFWDLLYAPEYNRRVELRIASAKNAAKSKGVFHLKPLYSNSEKYLIPKMLYTIEYSQQDADAFAAYYGVDSMVVSRCHF